jgi:integrase
MGRQSPFQGGRHGVRCTAGLRRPTPIASDPARLPPRPPATQQRPALPARPTNLEEIVAVMRAADDHPDGIRLRGLIVVLWRAGLRISEALALSESDPDRSRGAILVRHGKGGKRREVGMDRWAWEQLDLWIGLRASAPVGALFCVLRGPTRGRPCSAAGIRVQLRDAAVRAGVRRRFAPHQLRHAPSRCHAKACRWSSSTANSGTRFSGSRLCTCGGSTTRRSFTLSTSDRRR